MVVVAGRVGMLLAHFLSQGGGMKWWGLSGDCHHIQCHIWGVDGSGCARAWVLGGLRVAGVVGAGVCSGDGHRIGAGVVSCPCEGVRVEEMNVGSHITSKFVRLLSL